MDKEKLPLAVWLKLLKWSDWDNQRVGTDGEDRFGCGRHISADLVIDRDLVDQPIRFAPMHVDIRCLDIRCLRYVQAELMNCSPFLMFLGNLNLISTKPPIQPRHGETYSARQPLSSSSSSADKAPTGWTFFTPSGPSSTFVAKYSTPSEA